MTTKQGQEAVAEAHVATINAQLATEMTNVWAMWADTLVQPTFVVVLPTDISEQQHDFPAISVVAEEGDVIEDGTPLWQLITYHLRVLVYLTSDDVTLLQKSMMRTLLALRRMYMHNPNLDNATLANYSGTTVGKVALFETMGHKKTGQLLQIGGLHVTTTVGETY